MVIICLIFVLVVCDTLVLDYFLLKEIIKDIKKGKENNGEKFNEKDNSNE